MNTPENARIRSLGYVTIDATDLDEWERYATELLGMQVAKRTDDLLELRIDVKEYRYQIRRADKDQLTALGWEVNGPADLAVLSERLRGAGYTVTDYTREQLREKRISGGAWFRDPDGNMDLELHYGLRESFDAFASPNGAHFITGDGGMGHLMQFVDDVDKHRELYLDLLGFTISDYVDGGRDGNVELTFLHCNPRHHSYAFGHIDGVPAGIGHLMLELTSIDVVGRAWDKVLIDGYADIIQTLGMHTNDKMISFYAKTPAGFAIEYGTGGILIDDDTWTPTRYPGAHYWGHQRPAPKA